MNALYCRHVRRNSGVLVLVEKVSGWRQLNGYKGLSDEDIITAIRSGDADALDYLIKKYQPFVGLKSRSYFLVGGDRDDVVQEGMIGLYKAIRDYRHGKIGAFKGFAELCITRQIITAIKTATRQKHIPLNTSVSLDKPVYVEESERTLFDILPEETFEGPEEILIFQERAQHLEVEVGKVLSLLERQVLSLYLDGRSYQEISEQLRREVKSVDNALQRIKRKMTHHLIGTEV